MSIGKQLLEIKGMLLGLDERVEMLEISQLGDEEIMAFRKMMTSLVKPKVRDMSHLMPPAPLYTDIELKCDCAHLAKSSITKKPICKLCNELYCMNEVCCWYKKKAV